MLIKCARCGNSFELPPGTTEDGGPPACPQCTGKSKGPLAPQRPTPASAFSRSVGAAPAKAAAPAPPPEFEPVTGTVKSTPAALQGGPLRLPDGRTVTLSVIEGNSKGQRYPLLKPVTTIGRRTGDIVLEDSEVSGSHAAIRVVEGECYLRDLSSTNGTFLNGNRVTEATLSHLDEIRLGQTKLIVLMIQQSALAPDE